MKRLFIVLLLCISTLLQAQLPEQIQLPDHKGFRMKNYQESRYGFIYITRDDRVFVISGEQIKNPNKITEGLKHNRNNVDRAYVFADKLTPYRTVDKINAAVTRSGVANICYMMRFPEWSVRPYGYIKELKVPVIGYTTNTKKEIIPDNTLTHNYITIVSEDHSIKLKNGKQMDVESQEYKEMINASDTITVDYMDDISYGDYIFWLEKTRKIIKKQRRRKRNKTEIQELPKELMKYH